ncbi:MAG: phenylacetate-CoA oxygenase subunit PaaC [Acidimicrobiales bacterium]|nr:phenylacetate-CoA oxygenase subunit PaaC [Acidimicrobiales bacterium]
MTITDPGVSEYLLCFADDEHLMGQQHTEWIGVAPFLEEDLAFASIGQDELGHAAALYALLVGDDDRAIDDLALRRDAADYRSCHLVEVDTGDWVQALVRHWLYDAAESLRWQVFADSAVTGLAGTAARAQREEVFHRRHADALLDALLSVPESASRLDTAFRHLLPVALGIFEPVEGETVALEAGVASESIAGLRPAWQELVVARFGPVDWHSITPPDQAGRRLRSADFAVRYARMREVNDLDPAAVW